MKNIIKKVLAAVLIISMVAAMGAPISAASSYYSNQTMMYKNRQGSLCLFGCTDWLTAQVLCDSIQTHQKDVYCVVAVKIGKKVSLNMVEVQSLDNRVAINFYLKTQGKGTKRTLVPAIYTCNVCYQPKKKKVPTILCWFSFEVNKNGIVKSKNDKIRSSAS